MHFPSMQFLPTAHWTPHAPQCWLSLAVLTQPDVPQLAWPGGHPAFPPEHSPLTQLLPATHWVSSAYYDSLEHYSSRSSGCRS